MRVLRSEPLILATEVVGFEGGEAIHEKTPALNRVPI